MENSNWILQMLKSAGPLRHPAVHTQDETRRELQRLMTDGYTTLTWIAGNQACQKCKDAAMDYVDVSIEDFISGLEFNAPMFEKTHVDCKSCHLLIKGDDVPMIRLYPNGSVEEEL
jgi:hypothetical protein